MGRHGIRAGAAATAAATLCALSAGTSAGAGVLMPIPIGGPSNASYGGTYTVTGSTGTLFGKHFAGEVVLRGSWNGGRWMTLVRRRTGTAGDYRLTIALRRRGTLRLRLLLPHGALATKTLHVT